MRDSSDIVRLVIRQFAGDDRVEFCYPLMSIYHSPKTALAANPESGQ